MTQQQAECQAVIDDPNHAKLPPLIATNQRTL